MQENVLKYKGLIRSIIKKITGQYNEDIEQDIYIKIWQKQQQYQEQGKISSWLGAVAVNTCKDYLKSRFNKENSAKIGGDELLEKVSSTPKFEEKIDAKKRQKIILKAIDNLPKDLKKVVMLYEFEELSYTDIAKKLDVAEGTVKSRLFNARKILSQKLEFLKGEK